MVITDKDFNSPELQELYESHPRWVCIVKDANNGEEYLARPDKHPIDCWKELGRYLKEHSSLSIISMMIGFRDNCVAFPVHADGYFFRCSILATHGWEKHSFIAGVLKDGVLELDKYELPEMSHLGKEQRSIEGAGESLILAGVKCEKEF